MMWYIGHRRIRKFVMETGRFILWDMDSVTVTGRGLKE
jgi:hypothetical protein